jgi:hypothetical protein
VNPKTGQGPKADLDTLILHIAANALLEIKKRKLLMATQNSYKIIETVGRNGADPARVYGMC